MKKTANIAFALMCLLMVFATGCGPPTIHKAAEKGDLAKVEWYLQKGADVNAKDENGWTPLLWAAFMGHLEVVKFLVDKGSDVNARNKDGLTPLVAATGKDPLLASAFDGHRDVVEFLKEHGAKE